MKIEEKFSKELVRTDKYRTMFVRQCRKVLAETVSLIGIDSYSKSTSVDRFLPEYQKRYTQMKRLIERQLSIDVGSSLSSAASLDS